MQNYLLWRFVYPHMEFLPPLRSAFLQLQAFHGSPKMSLNRTIVDSCVDLVREVGLGSLSTDFMDGYWI